ncbi:helix-turn-helix transcriptional regulator [Shewanella decolorationis]|uniref:helix-turn-helix transcriptional regulator n=1 Tax=Shewanella decolorationis TaxID=256839 RepID=UPI000587763F|nr:AlpA family phage regulatory protein [Shewanella decolorationis]GLR34511.1 Mu phage lytic protein AlpA [Shewanella decolorationis]
MNTTLTSNSIIRLKTLVQLTGLSRSTIYDKLNPKSPRFDPLFPRKVCLGARAVGWYFGEVEAWLKSIRVQ